MQSFDLFIYQVIVPFDLAVLLGNLYGIACRITLVLAFLSLSVFLVGNRSAFSLCFTIIPAFCFVSTPVPMGALVVTSGNQKDIDIEVSKLF